MRLLTKLRRKINLTLLLLELPAFLLLFLLMVNRYNRLAESESLARAEKETEAFAQHFSSILNDAMGSVRMVSRLLNGTDGDHVSQDIALFETLAPKIVTLQPSLANLWLAIDYRYIDRGYHRVDGYKVVLYSLVNGDPKQDNWVMDTAGVNSSPQYSSVRNANREMTIGPYNGVLGRDGVTLPLLSMSAPIRDRTGAPAGVISADLMLDWFQSLINGMKTYEGSYALLLSDRMEVVAGPSKASVGLPAAEVLSNLPDFQGLTERWRNGERITLPFKSTATLDDYLLISHPFRIGQDEHSWTLCLVVPHRALLGRVDLFKELVLFFMLLTVAIVIIGGSQILRHFLRPLTPILTSLEQLSYGRVDGAIPLPHTENDEFARIAESLERLRANLMEKVHFANALGDGNYQATLTPVEQDALGRSLMDLRENLRQAEGRDRLQREHEEQQRWSTQGIAEFAEIIRMDRDNLEDFTYQFIHALANYTHSNIAALYLRRVQGGAFGEGSPTDEDVEYALSSAYAYQVRKHTQAVFKKYQGLVGRCVAERKMIYLTELPSDYITIASGLGQSKPNALLVMPAFQKDELIGVLEIARFSAYREHEIQFIQTVLNSLAATLDVFFSNLQTRKLLQEAQRQSVQMQEQREEMQQNIEEMQAIQEEAARQRQENESLQRALQNSCCIAEYDPQGRLISANNTYLSLVRQSLSDVLHTHFTEALRFEDRNGENYQRFWSDLLQGKVKRNVRTRIRLGGGQELQMVETYSPIQDEHGNVVRIMKIAFDLTPFIAEASTDTLSTDSAQESK